MAKNAYVSWVVRSRPWEPERYLITALDLPLNTIDPSLNKTDITDYADAVSLARTGGGPHNVRKQRAAGLARTQWRPHELGAVDRAL